MPDLKNKNVAVCDFSYNRSITESLLQSCSSFVVLDHHESAMKALAGLPNTRFDSNHSGAVITWKYFHPDKVRCDSAALRSAVFLFHPFYFSQVAPNKRIQSLTARAVISTIH